MSLDEELKGLTPLTPELQAAVSRVLRLTSQSNGFILGILVIPGNPPVLSVVTNKTDLTGAKIAKVFREYADAIDIRVQDENFFTVDITGSDLVDPNVS